MFAIRQVKGCPLKVTVTAMCDASKVVCSGEGLGVGTVGKHIRSFIDTRSAGPGKYCFQIEIIFNLKKKKNTCFKI